MNRTSPSATLLLLACLFALSLPVAAPAPAQSLTRGVLQGEVVDSAGLPLDDATLTLRDRAVGTLRTVTTGRDGRFAYMLLLPGSYDLLVERFGYRPQRIAEIAVATGRRQVQPIVLRRSDDVSSGVGEVRAGGGGGGRSGAGAVRSFSALELAGLPTDRRDVSWLGALSSESDENLGGQGLPASLSGVFVDGLPVVLARHASAPRGALDAAHFPLTAFERAEMVTDGTDVEWSGAGGILSVHSLRGTPEFHLRGFGGWSAADPAAAAPASGIAGSYRGMQAGFLATGPIVRDTASFAAGLEVWRAETGGPPSGGPDSLSALVGAIAADSYGVTLPGRSPLRSDALSGFLRVDWQLSAAHQLSARTSFAAIPNAYQGTPPVPGLAGSGRFEGNQLSAAVDLASRLGSRLFQELRFGVDYSSRIFAPEPSLEAGGSGSGGPSTYILTDGREHGSGATPGGSYRQGALRASETFYLQSGAHLFKLGLAATLHGYDHRSDERRSGEFFFSGPGGFARGEGMFTQSLAGSREARFGIPQLALYLQDSWVAAPGLEVVAGGRADVEWLPRGQIAVNEAWLDATGLSNAGFDATRVSFNPRLRFRWDVRERSLWFLTGSAGLFAGSLDPTIVSELLAYDGGLEVRGGIGSLEAWPLLPDSTVAPSLGSRLMLLSPEFSGPRTARAEVGITRRFGPRTALHLLTSYRATSLLPRRSDLNLAAAPRAEDQYGRPLFGTLRERGGVLAAENGSNRRFQGFERVIAVNSDGRSIYQGVTLAAEHRSGAWLDLSASYTASRTRDNWLASRSLGADLVPFPRASGGDDWTEGAADLDVTHRAVIAVEASPVPLPALRVAALFRYRSGLPFTPGFRDGIDANGDGSYTNDPAFVDAALPGMSELLEAWPCLEASLGAFAARNSCRGPDAYSLDLRLSLRVARAGRFAVAVVADGLNLASSGGFLPDRALLHLDDQRSMTTDPLTGVVTVPLRVNPTFGRPFLGSGAARVLRLALRVSY